MLILNKGLMLIGLAVIRSAITKAIHISYWQALDAAILDWPLAAGTDRSVEVGNTTPQHRDHSHPSSAEVAGLSASQGDGDSCIYPYKCTHAHIDGRLV